LKNDIPVEIKDGNHRLVAAKVLGLQSMFALVWNK
jgi:hypothetical protein